MAFTLPNFPINDASHSLSAALQRVMGARLAAAQSQQQENRNPYEAQDIQSAIQQRLAQAGNLNESTKWMRPLNESTIRLQGMQGKNLESEIGDRSFKQRYPELGQNTPTGNLSYRRWLADNGQSVPAINPMTPQVQDSQPINVDNMSRHDLVSRANADQSRYDNNNQDSNLLAQGLLKYLDHSQRDKYGMTLADQPGQPLANSLADRMTMGQPASAEKIPLAESISATQQPQQVIPENKKAAQMSDTDVVNKNIDNMLALEAAKSQYYTQGGASGLGAGGKALNLISSEIQKAYPDLAPEQVIDARNRFMAGEKTFTNGDPLPPLTPAIESAISKNFKGDTDVSQRNQQRFAATAENLFKIADSHIEDASKFVSIVGKLNGNIEAAKGQTGESSPEYQSFRLFMDQDVPAIVSEIIRAGGAHSTDSQKAMAIQQTMANKGLTNPKLFKASWAELKKLYREVGKSAGTPNYQLKNQIAGGGDAAPVAANNNVSQQSKYGHLSDDELEAKIKAAQGGA